MEQEFFLVDEEGVLSNRADEFLDECREAASAAGRDPEGFAPECARSMVEVNTPPVHTLTELAREYLTSHGSGRFVYPTWGQHAHEVLVLDLT